jgi:predicted nicotinamide N-methyase
VSLPFWAKLWPSNIILAYYLNRMELAPGARVLEIGAGGGLAGLVTALRGAPTVLSDVDDNALLFCRINALKNGLGDAVEVRRVDFTTERPEDRFEYVVGCEVLYQEDVYRPLVKFLAHTLAPTPGSQVVLARDYARRARRFFKLADRDFAITEKTIGCKAAGESGEPERHLICISRLTPRRGQAERERPEPDHAGGDA